MDGKKIYSVFLTTIAELERNDIVEWYAKVAPSQAAKWLDELDNLIDRLEKNPFQYAEHLLFIRRAKLRAFPHRVFYAIDEINGFVGIIAIQHSSRNPAIIRRRINF